MLQGNKSALMVRRGDLATRYPPDPPGLRYDLCSYLTSFIKDTILDARTRSGLGIGEGTVTLCSGVHGCYPSGTSNQTPEFPPGATLIHCYYITSSVLDLADSAESIAKILSERREKITQGNTPDWTPIQRVT